MQSAFTSARVVVTGWPDVSVLSAASAGDRAVYGAGLEGGRWFDRGDAQASLGSTHRQCLAWFSTAEDKGIEMFNGDHGPLPFEGWCHCYFLRSPHGYLNVGQGCSASR